MTVPPCCTLTRLSYCAVAAIDYTPSPLSGTQDLISLFQLESVYDTFLRPYLPDTIRGDASHDHTNHAPDFKGKSSELTTSIGISIGGVKFGQVDKTQNSSTKERKPQMGKTYTSIVSDVPGRNNIKKDNYLRDLVLNPDAPPVRISALDSTTLRDAFTLKPGVIPGFDAQIWESSHHENDGGKKRKKRKLGGEGGTGGQDSGAAHPSSAGTAEDSHSRKKKKRKGAHQNEANS